MMPPPRHTMRARLGCALLLALTAAGCSGDPPVTPPPAQDPTTLYWQLTLNEHAVTLSTVAPYDTVRIVATPRTISGTPISDLGRPTYTSLDLDRAFVDSTGLVHAIGAGDQSTVQPDVDQGGIAVAEIDGADDASEEAARDDPAEGSR